MLLLAVVHLPLTLYLSARRGLSVVTVGDRAFPVAAAKLWNKLPGDVTASQSLAAFRRQLKTCLFCISYPVL